jgi:hypothetical protein
VSVDDDLLPNEIHVAHSARSVSQADRSSVAIEWSIADRLAVPQMNPSARHSVHGPDGRGPGSAWANEEISVD